MMIIRMTLVIAIPLSLCGYTRALADCAIPKMREVTMGAFKVLSTSPMEVQCVDSLPSFKAASSKGKMSSFVAPGCLLHLKRLTQPEEGFDDSKSYEAYYEKNDCSKQVGKTLKLQLGSQCCPEPLPRCDQDPGKNNSSNAAYDRLMVCAPTHSSRWMIYTSKWNIEPVFDRLRQIHSEAYTKK